MKIVFTKEEHAKYVGHKPGAEPSPENKALYRFISFVNKQGGEVESEIKG